MGKGFSSEMALIQADDKTVPMKHNKIILLGNMIANMWSSETLASLRDRRSSLLEHEANETKVKGRQTNSLWQKKRPQNAMKRLIKVR